MDLVLLLPAATGWTGGTGKAVEIAVRAISDRWCQPDAGIWELSDRVWTHSRFICPAGLRAVAAVAPRHPPAETCTSLADTLLDAAPLLPGPRDALSAADPRTRATLALATYRRERPWFARRQLGGNLPQVFVPALLLEAAARLGE